ncbi:hypothetical protein [Rhizobium terrae]|uniref:hypothetical protein n=1 Tax=Rhizobium terrae TaxID=2171756 RepID=UPI0013C2FF4C|nr:hypothetical protein [Rhizobium terrae]
MGKYRCALVAAAMAITAGCTPSVAGGPNLSQYNGVTSAYFADGYSAKRLRAYHETDEADRRGIRNSIVLSAMGSIDVQYARFSAELTQESQGVPFLATLTSLSLSGAGTLAAAKAAKTALAAVDTGIKGAHAAYDKNILSEKTIQFLQKQMRANRNRVRSSILSKLALDTAAYPLELALMDVNEYASAGTITAGLIGIDEQTSDVLARSEDAKVETVYAFSADNASALINGYIDKSPDAPQTIRQWLAQEKIAASLTEFVYAPQFASSRARFVQAKGLR